MSVAEKRANKSKREAVVSGPQIFVDTTADNQLEIKPLKDIVYGVQPISYEDELVQRGAEIMRDSLSEILLFPDDDLVIFELRRELRTEYSTVPPLAFREATNLFVQECIRLYTADWFVIENQYFPYAGSHYLLTRPRITDDLMPQIFEIDADEDETDASQVSGLVPMKEKGIFKEGYLTKAPFHSDGNPIYGSKTYKRRWFTLKQISTDGSYVLDYRKDESSVMAKGSLYLDSCTQITKGLKGRMYGFQLHIQDKEYGLASDSLSEMESWVTALCKATGIHIEQEKPTRKLFSGKKHHHKQSNLRESLKHSSHPLLQEYARETDQANLKKRQEDRLPLFAIYPDLGNQYNVISDVLPDEISPYKETFGNRFVVTCDELRFKLCRPVEGGRKFDNCEPFVTILCLFDAKKGLKISEDFVCDLNSKSLREMLSKEPSMNGHLYDSEGQHDTEEFSYPKKAVFSVSHPHAEIYLLLRIEKVLQGGIGQCTEPYIKSYDSSKVADKTHRQASVASKRLGKYTMPFGWAARTVFTAKGDIDTDAEFTSIFKQDAAKISDDEIIKFLQEMRGEGKLKLPVIPGLFTCSLSTLSSNFPNCFSPSLIPLKPFSRSTDVPTSMEVQEFYVDSPSAAFPHTTYVNNLYVTPISLNFGSQKAFSKARNIACSIQFKDEDNITSPAVKCIFSRDGTSTFTTEIVTPVLHHNTVPSFYAEVKIHLPTHLHKKHHVLFTFYHVSVEQPKSETGNKKKQSLETPVGYAWMPILDGGLILPKDNSLSVASFLPEGYLSCQLGEGTKSPGPDVKWVDVKGSSLFKVNTKLNSTVYTHDSAINKFFTHWQNVQYNREGSDAETSRLLKLMHGVDVATVIRFMPVILNQLLDILISNDNEDVALNVVKVLIRIVQLVHSVEKGYLLRAYVKFIFKMEDLNKKTVHEELVRHLIYLLRPGADPTVINNLLELPWFFFGVIVKSMAQTHMHEEESRRLNGLHEARDLRYPLEYHRHMENLLQMYVQQLLGKTKDEPAIVKSANESLALFIKNCFTHMDRGFVFQMVNFVKDRFNKAADTQMYELKFEFLRIVCEHEHYVALNLPLDIRALGGVHESTLNDVFCKKHFLAGLVLREMSSALNEGKVVRRGAIRLLRNLLVKHEFDDRYSSKDKQSRIAALYLPYLTIMLEQSLRFHKNLDRPVIDNSLLSSHHNPNLLGRQSPAPSARNSMVLGASGNDRHADMTPTNINSYVSVDPSGKSPPVLPFEEEEKKELSICFMYILKSVKPDIIVDWWRDILTSTLKRPHWAPTALYYVQHDKNYAKFVAVIDFFDLIEGCLKTFAYAGRESAEERCNTTEHTKQYIEQRYTTGTRSSPKTSTSSIGHSRNFSNGTGISSVISMDDIQKRLLCEANLSNETAFVVLDTIELFCTHFKFHLEQDDGDNFLMKKIFNVLMTFLRLDQSELVMRHVFAALRSFINKFPAALFKRSANLCGVLCYEILRLCNSKIESIRTQACCFMYLLMRSNFEFSGTGCVRVHLQVIVAVSKLIASGVNRSSMNHSLIAIKSYSGEDKSLSNTDFPSEVRDLIKKVHTVLQATSQMKEHEDDHEFLVDLQYSLAKSYSSTPELRQTWLQSMANIHESNGDLSEAAMCYVHAAALVAEYLQRKGVFPYGCMAFKGISPNVFADESVMKDDEGSSVEIRYTAKDLIDLLEAAATRLKRAERYEVMGEVFKLSIPLYENERNFRQLSLAYSMLKDAYEKVVEVMASGKRLLGQYYRVAFFGRAFKDDDGKEFIYKEPKITGLAEISDRLLKKYKRKYGNIKIIQESSKVKLEELNPAMNYIQVTFVQTYFDEEELEKRHTEFERVNNIRRFVFETPFTLSGKSHGELAEQHKRKTILTTSHCFPYVKKRILVVQQEIYELTPLEVAIDEMQTKVKALNHAVSLDPPDMKKLQLNLQGSVSVQVNAGPMAYARTFLDQSVVKNYPVKHVEALQLVYREFIQSCGKALQVNRILIKEDQFKYHEDLNDKYEDMKKKLDRFIGIPGSTERLLNGGYMDADV